MRGLYSWPLFPVTCSCVHPVCTRGIHGSKQELRVPVLCIWNIFDGWGQRVSDLLNWVFLAWKCLHLHHLSSRGLQRQGGQ